MCGCTVAENPRAKHEFPCTAATPTVAITLFIWSRIICAVAIAEKLSQTRVRGTETERERDTPREMLPHAPCSASARPVEVLISFVCY